MAPLGLGDELRVALRSNSSTWGVMCLHREDGPRGFDAEDQRILATLSPHIAEGLRRATVLEEAVHAPEEAGPGVIVLEPDLSTSAITPAAERLVREIGTDWPSAGGLPVPIYTVAARLLAMEGAGDADALPRVTVRGSSGRWLTLHASHLRGRAPGVVVVLEPARSEDEVPIMLLAHGLTTREAEVARLVVRGYSTRQVVDRLHISRHTVQDHLKAVFDKLGVRSRRELVAQLLRQRHN
jgi:DNA-binding CsgD family transcriptional regulator